MKSEQLPGWVEAEILEGLAGLFLLRLDGTPANDLQDATANVWLIAVASRGRAWTPGVDEKRLRGAFRDLYATAVKWPSPAQFLQVLQGHGEASHRHALPAPPLTAADKARGRQMLERLRREFDAFVGPRQPTPSMSRAELDKYLDEQVARWRSDTNQE